MFQKTREINSFVISVGNITFGGTGKTPLSIALAKHYDALVLMRGYKGLASKEGFYQDRDPKTWTDRGKLTKLMGDEAILYLMNNIPVLIGANRYKAWMKFPEAHKKNVILDDGFQHKTIKKNFQICCIDASAPMSEYRIPPFGRLRSFPKKVREANLVVLTRSDLVDDEKILQIKNYFNLKKFILFKNYEYHVEHVLCLDKGRYHLVAGIGNPNQIIKVASKILKIEKQTILQDHALPSPELIYRLNRDSLIPLLTLKDAVKWAHQLDRFAVLHQRISEVDLLSVYNEIDQFNPSHNSIPT